MTLRPRGPYLVGFCDLSFDSNPTGAITSETHLFGRLFYPCKPQTQWTFVPWLPTPAGVYASGFANFMFRAPWLQSWKHWCMQQLLKPVIYCAGGWLSMPLLRHAAFADMPHDAPIVIASHGLGGIRTLNTLLVSELVSHGCVVLALEHADGSASVARLAGNRGWLWYRRLTDEQEWHGRMAWRIREMQSSLDLLSRINDGSANDGSCQLHGASHLFRQMRGKLNTHACTALGFSFGGATAAAVAVDDKRFNVGISLDPWWSALDPKHAVLHKWHSTPNVLILGSEDFNRPRADGTAICGLERQSAIMAAAAAAPSPGAAVLAVVKGTSHHSFDDLLPLFADRLAPVLKLFNVRVTIDPFLAATMVADMCLSFLCRHLPLPHDHGFRLHCARTVDTRVTQSSSHHSISHISASKPHLASNSELHTAAVKSAHVPASKHSAVLAVSQPDRLEIDTNGDTAALMDADIDAKVAAATVGRDEAVDAVRSVSVLQTLLNSKQRSATEELELYKSLLGAHWLDVRHAEAAEAVLRPV